MKVLQYIFYSIRMSLEKLHYFKERNMEFEIDLATKTKPYVSRET